jgi:hypothetical protein
MFKEIIAVYSGNHMKQINTLCEKISELLVIKAGGTYRYHWALRRHLVARISLMENT